MKTLFIAGVFLLLNFSEVYSQSDITEKELSQHLQFLASTDQKGRYPGTPESEAVQKYLQAEFNKSKIQAFKNGYVQAFDAKLRIKEDVSAAPLAKASNIIGLIPGSDPVLKNEYIVIGAHYDHLGMGGPSSKKPDTVAIHPGADDNASGTIALLEIGEKLAANRSQLKRSIILVAFGAEEQGLLGSKYFVENPPVPLNQIKLMINMDMVGRLNAEQEVYMGGAGSFPGGMELMEGLGKEFKIKPVVHAYEVGGSDHVSFFQKNISVLGIHTGGHPQYHTPEDVASLINIPGEKRVCDYIYAAALQIANREAGGLSFIPEGKSNHPDITEEELREHIEFLASPDLKGRLPGSPESERVRAFIQDEFRKSKIAKLNDSYLQPFKSTIQLKDFNYKNQEKTYEQAITATNVIGLIPGSDPTLKDEYIVLGAHYDHLGMGGPLSLQPEKQALHPGADDNASGTSALLEIAEKLSANRAQLKRSIIIVAFDSEEQGLLGSKYFVDNPPVPLEKIKFVFNMDMVGRLNNEQFFGISGVYTFADAKEFVESFTIPLGFKLNFYPDIEHGSDEKAFFNKGIPGLGVTTGFHPQYHTPEDTADLINIPGEKKIADLLYAAMLQIANRDEPLPYLKAQESN